MQDCHPIYFQVDGHPLVQNIVINWSASEGMIPQTLYFDSIGGKTESIVITQNLSKVVIKYVAKISFLPKNWSLLKIEDSLRLSERDNQIYLSLSQWIKTLSVGIEIDQSNTSSNSETEHDHLVINLTWQIPEMERATKISQRVTSSNPLQTFYLKRPDGQAPVAKISAFGIVGNQLIQVPQQEIELNSEQLSLRIDQNSVSIC